ncbi:MAG TPA: putative toxin-antitoxin system toxin component, PIN family [Gammaproteobacteria bacterium]|nr:putative toxin-antitoxin system toxin component, PIN family [Gammaproteobacteria bacterium]
MYRFVLDTDVIIAALRSPGGASAALVGAALDHQIVILASVPLFFEYEAKCTSPVHWTAAGLTHDQAHVFVEGLTALIEPVKTHYLWRPTLRDPNDEMVLETAVNGRADAIVTFNIRDYGAVPGRFDIEVLTPATAIRRVRNE